ncbi:hypothetical protein Trisim1_004459 [Trichoderma cf. simile WF8]
MSTTKRPQALARLAQSASSTPCGSNEMDASSRTRAQSGAAPDTSMRPNGSPLPPGGPASSIVPASTGSSTKHVRPTNRRWSRIAIRALPSSSLLSCSLLFSFSSSGSVSAPERPDRSRQTRPFGQWPRQFVFRHAPRRLTCNNREQVCRE